MIYCDWAATSPLCSEAAGAMEPWLRFAGNPSSQHSLGREAARAVRDARERIAGCIGALPEEICFTSCGTEADNLAVKGCAVKAMAAWGPKRFVVSSIEHPAVLSTCAGLEPLGFRTARLPADREGRVDPASLEEALKERTALVSVMTANNEIGTVEPVRALCAAAHQKGVLFHTDAVQAVGHIPVDVEDLGVDLLSASAHKFSGPRGVGFLYIRRGTGLAPLLDGGGQERGVRSGTENVAGIAGMAAALDAGCKKMRREAARLEEMRCRILAGLADVKADYIINGSADRLPGFLSLSFKNMDGEMLLHRLDLMGVAVSTGSACHAGKEEVSPVIRAIGVGEEYRRGTIRLTLGPGNTMEEAVQIAAALREAVRERV